jgi:glycosyltransferase involved in cell wall biosynthesis
MNEAFRTLQTIQSLNNKLGGATHAGLNISRYLSAAQHPVEVLSTFDRNDEIEYLRSTYSGLKMSLIPRRFPKRWYNGIGLGQWLDGNLSRFDLVGIHAVFSFVTIKTSHYCKKHKLPFVLHPHGSLDPFDLKKRKLIKSLLGPILFKPLLQNCAGVVCTTQNEADLLETYGTKPRKFVVPLPVPTLTSGRSSRQSFRQKHGIPNDAFVVLFLSRIDYKKGLEFLVPAISLARESFKDVWFVMAGAGEEWFVSKIRSMISQLGLSRWTREIGFVSGYDKAEAFGAADLFALPSLNENFGIVIIEAMQSGLPVLISDQVYIHQEIYDAGAGKVCAANSDDCGRVLLEFLRDRPSTIEMGARGSRLAAKRFGPEAATQNLLDVYKTVLNR